MKFALGLFRGFVCTALSALMGGIIYFNEKLPDSYCVSAGSPLSFGSCVEISSECIVPENYSVYEDGCTEAALTSGIAGTRTEQLRLFGIFPIKNVSVTEVSAPAVIPCGTPFGIKLLTEGVLVVEISGFECTEGIVSPADEAGIKEGDIIMSISGSKVSSNKDVSAVIEKSKGRTLEVGLMRDGQRRIVFIKPQRSSADGAYRAGMWVRDSSAGIGTVTFYDPSSGIFAGLGHPVCDTDTGEILTMSEGEAAEVYISGIRKSSEGAPGELVGMFTSDEAGGELISNCTSGIYGRMDSCPADRCAAEVAMRQEIKPGKAEIYATIKGNKAQVYSVEIEKVDYSGGSECHDLVIRVTDELLLDDAGGIVQGMSGSPIIQNGKLVGAVTHVLVRDPTRGYGIFADRMIEEVKNITEGA